MELRSEIESLLSNEAGAAGALDSLVAHDIEGLVETSSAAESGARLGPHRLVRQLNSGGMGIVYLAVRSDDHYFQIVAIKIIRKGVHSPDLIQRFRAERQILATLSHPNIGTILDGGETKDGRPFIVMEYVEGQPITVACANRGLSVRERIDLFRCVCNAVHYAHQKLVIHRDIKPGNVLVTPQGIVKLIDFGISKTLAPGLIQSELPPTEADRRFMTPDYASPEQIQGRDLTTASDIYSLGVLLFELLTGSRPYTLHNLSPAAAERLVCHEECPRPSAVRELPERTKRELAGDLDRIVLMAMEKDPSRRYRSAQHLEEDLLRFLKGKPVVASEPTAIYMLTKFVKRHKTAFLATCATLLMMATSIVFHSWQSRVADRRMRQITALADSAISDLTELELTPSSSEAQTSVFLNALKHLEQARQTSGDDPGLLLEISKAYTRIGDLEGSPFVANLGKTRAAITSYREALRTALAANDQLHTQESATAVVEAHQRLGAIEFFVGDIPGAHEDYRRSLSLATDAWLLEPENPALVRLLSMSYARLGDLQLDNLETNEALASFREAFDIFGTEANGEADHDLWLMKLYIRMGGALLEHGDSPQAVRNLQKSIAVAESMAQKSPSASQANDNLLEVYIDIIGPLVGTDALNVGDSAQAEIYARKALAIAEPLGSRDSKNIRARADLTFAYESMGDSLRLTRPDMAGQWYRKSIALTKEIAAAYPVGSEARHWIASRDEELAAVLGAKKHALERLQLLKDANRIWNELVRASQGRPQFRMSLMRSYCKLIDAELAAGNLAQARQFAQGALPFLSEFTPASPSRLVLRDVGFCDTSLGNLQRRIAEDRSLGALERHAAERESHDWFQKSNDVWNEWNRRGSPTPESELERNKVLRWLQEKKMIETHGRLR
jgi:serine/threonine protein kinase